MGTKIEKKEFIYEGKAKRLYKTSDENKIIIEFKDDLTAFNAEKKGSFEGKGLVNLQITNLIFSYLKLKGIPSHWIEQISDTEAVVEKVEIIPLEVVIRNRAAGSIVKRLGFEEGHVFSEPVFEVFYKDDALGDPLLTREHVRMLKLCSDEDYEVLRAKALEISKHLTDLFKEIDISLVDFKIEFGKNSQGEIVLSDEITPDSCRLWDIETLEKLDKDRFRKDLGKVKESYELILLKLREQLN